MNFVPTKKRNNMLKCKKTFLIAIVASFISIATSTKLLGQQNLFNTSLSFNTWDEGSIDFMSIEVDYERALIKKLGVELGVNYVFPVLDSKGGFGVDGNVNFYFKDYTKGVFLGGGLGVGSIDNTSYVKFGGELGYNIPLANSRISPSIGVGLFSLGFGGGDALAFKLNYSYFF